jgi:hypothetical protein
MSYVQGFFMGLLFLIAGYFVPASYDKKGALKFIKDRFIRLGIPTLVYMVIINPFIEIVIMNYYKVSGIGYLTSYAKYLVSIDFIRGTGPLWFTLALLIFSIVYALIMKIINPKININKKDFPSFLKILMLIVLISFFAFLIRIFLPIGTNILNMQLCNFSQYIILFIVGIKCKRNEWFEKIDYAIRGKLWLISALTLGIILWSVIMILGGALTSGFDVFMGGLHWQSVAYCLWESFVSISMSIGLITFFREKFDEQNKLFKIMSDNAFSVYVFHAPIVVAITLLFSSVHLIPVLKSIMMSIIIIPICFLIINFTIWKIPFLRKLFA